MFTRVIRGWHLGTGLDQELTLAALRRCLEHSRPETHHSDQGVQYAATTYSVFAYLEAAVGAWFEGAEAPSLLPES